MTPDTPKPLQRYTILPGGLRSPAPNGPYMLAADVLDRISALERVCEAARAVTNDVLFRGDPRQSSLVGLANALAALDRTDTETTR